MVFTLQKNLNKAGFDAGRPDGIIGSMTKEAIQKFQLSVGFIADGYPDQTTISKLSTL